MTTATKSQLDVLYEHICRALDAVRSALPASPHDPSHQVCTRYVLEPSVLIEKRIKVLEKTYAIEQVWLPFAEIALAERKMAGAIYLLCLDGFKIDLGEDSRSRPRRFETYFADNRQYILEDLCKRNEIKTAFDPSYAVTRKDGSKLLLEALPARRRSQAQRFESVDGSLYRETTYKGKPVTISLEGDGERVVGGRVHRWSPLE